MKTFIVLLVALIAFVYADEKYTVKYDNVNLDEILKNDRLLMNYVNCLLDKGSCSPDGTELKRVLPEALENDCAKCSEKQRMGSRKIVRFLIEKKREMWMELEAKYDKTGVYRKKYEAEVKNM